MNIKGIIIPNENYLNTITVTKFALRYFSDLHQNTKEILEDEGLDDGDIAIISLPYVGKAIARGYESTIENLYKNKEVTWIVFLIQDDLLEEGLVLKDDFINRLQTGKDIYTEYLTEMTSEKEIPLQTVEMMQIMDLCGKCYKKHQ